MVDLLFDYGLTASDVRWQAHEVETKDITDDEIKTKMNTWTLKAHNRAGLSAAVTNTDARYGDIQTYILYGCALEILGAFPNMDSLISSMRPILESAEENLAATGTGRNFGKTQGMNNYR